MKRTKLSAWLLTVVVFLISLGVIYWVGVPLGNPDANVLLAVEVVLAAAFAMFVNAIAYPQSRIGDQTGLGAPSVSFTVAVVTLAIAGLAAAFVGLRHPMVAAWLAGISGRFSRGSSRVSTGVRRSRTARVSARSGKWGSQRWPGKR